MGKMLIDQGSENYAIHLKLGNFVPKLMYYSQRGKKIKRNRKKKVCVGAVCDCALVSAQVLYLAKMTISLLPSRCVYALTA